MVQVVRCAHWDASPLAPLTHDVECPLSLKFNIAERQELAEIGSTLTSYTFPRTALFGKVGKSEGNRIRELRLGRKQAPSIVNGKDTEPYIFTCSAQTSKADIPDSSLV
jgi:hypothetical protein